MFAMQIAIQKLRQFTSHILPQGGFARNVTVLAGGTAIGQAISMIASPILTRLYSIQDFGNLQVYLSIMTFVILFSTWRYEYAIMLPDKDRTAANLLAVTVGIVIMMSIFTAFALWWIAGSHLLPENMNSLRPYLWLIPISMCGGGLYQVLSCWTLRQKSYKPVAATKLTQSFGQNITQLCMGFFRNGLLGLLLGDALGRMTGSLSFLRLLWRQNKKLFREVCLRDMWNAMVRFRNFPIISTGSALINTAGFSLPPLILAKFYGAMVLGWFALEMRVLEAPSALVGQSISQAYMSEAARLAISDPKAMHALFLKIMKRLLKLGAIPFAIAIVISHSLFALVFGESWREAGNYARLLAIMHYVSFAVWPLMPTLNILEKQSWQLMWDIGRLVFTIVCLLVVYYCGMSARWTIIAYGAAMTIGYVTHLFLSHRAIQERIKKIDLKEYNTY